MLAKNLYKVKDKKSDIYKKVHKMMMMNDEEVAKRAIKALIKYGEVLDLLKEGK